MPEDTKQPPQTSNSSMMSSKKAKAFLLAMPTWTFLIVLVLLIIGWQVYYGQQPSIWVVGLAMVMSVTKGFLEVGYIGGQAWLDSYSGIAEKAISAIPKQ